jgi:hypothetical protein
MARGGLELTSSLVTWLVAWLLILVSQFATLLKPMIHFGMGTDGAAAGAMQHFTLRAMWLTP